MKKILTLAAIAIIFTSNFANASTLNGGKAGLNTVKSSKNTKSNIKIYTKEFSVKGMQDTKDILLQIAPAA